MRAIAGVLLSMVVSACSTSLGAPIQSSDWNFEKALIQSELSGQMQPDGFINLTLKVGVEEQGSFRKFYKELKGEVGSVPRVVQNEVDEIYGELIEANFVSFTPTLRIVDCGSASARVNIIGEIELCRGALVRLATRDEIAYLLSHELAHVLLEHNDQLWNEPTLGVDLESTLFFTNSLTNLVQDSDFEVDWILGRVSDPRYSRGKISAAMSQHVFADLLGTDLMARAGFSTDGAYTAIVQMGGSTPPPGLWNEYIPSETRLEVLQDYVEKFHSDADLRPQTPLNWHQTGNAEAVAFFNAMRLLDEAVYELALAKTLDDMAGVSATTPARNGNIAAFAFSGNEGGKAHSQFSTKERAAAQRLFCDSARSKLQHAHELYLSTDPQVVEISLGIGAICDGGTWFDLTEALLAQIEGTSTDGAWREITRIFTLFNLGVPSSESGRRPDPNDRIDYNFSREIDQRFNDGEDSMNRLLRSSSGNLNIIGSLFVLNANMRVQYDDDLTSCLQTGKCRRSFEVSKFIQACRRSAGKPFGIVGAQYCEAYIGRLVEQIRVMYHRTEDVPGRTAFRKYTFPGSQVSAPSGASLDPMDYELYDWRRGLRIGTDIVIVDRLNAREAPNLRAKVAGQFAMGGMVYRTGRIDGEWIEVLLDRKKMWVHGKYLLRSSEIVFGQGSERARAIFGMESAVDFDSLRPDWNEVAVRSGINPAFGILTAN